VVVKTVKTDTSSVPVYSGLKSKEEFLKGLEGTLAELKQPACRNYGIMIAYAEKPTPEQMRDIAGWMETNAKYGGQSRTEQDSIFAGVFVLPGMLALYAERLRETLARHSTLKLGIAHEILSPSQTTEVFERIVQNAYNDMLTPRPAP
jgi:hypothetical protein